MRELPLIELKIDKDSESFVSAISLVDNPAIQSDFLAFSKQSLTFSNDERKELLGACMIPNQPIYRNTPNMGEYMCVFSAETIREIAQVFAQKGFFNNTNIEHSIIPAESFVFQSYIVDIDKNILPPKGIDVPTGSWIVGLKVLNDSVWNNIKAGKINGFSVEGVFRFIDTKTTVQLSKNETEEEEYNRYINELIELEKLRDNII